MLVMVVCRAISYFSPCFTWNDIRVVTEGQSKQSGNLKRKILCSVKSKHLAGFLSNRLRRKRIPADWHRAKAGLEICPRKERLVFVQWRCCSIAERTVVALLLETRDHSTLFYFVLIHSASTHGFGREVYAILS